MEKSIIEAEKSFIGAWYLDNLDLCDELIEYFDNHSQKHLGVSFQQGRRLVDPSKKDSLDLTLDYEDEMRIKYEDQLQKVVDKYVELYPESAKTPRWEVEGVNIQKYCPGSLGYAAWHCERGGGNHPSIWRHLVFMTYLNDVVTDGETEFLYQKIKVKPRKGLTLIWPSDWTHYHRGIASPTENKYIITGWFWFTNQIIEYY